MEEIRPDEVRIRSLERRDEPGISQVIHTVLEEYGGNVPGFAGSDWATDHLYDHYEQVKGRYYVVEAGGRIWGGCGFAPLEGETIEWCELQKMYFLKEIRGLGLAKKILEKCISGAREAGYRFMYLETLTNMHEAQNLYRKFQFRLIPQPQGDTGHFGCDVWMSREL